MVRQVLVIQPFDDTVDSFRVLRVLRRTAFFLPRCDDSVSYQSPPLIPEPFTLLLSVL